jgi:hypothetical protein
VAAHVVEVDGAEWDERRGGIGGRPRELGVEGRPEVIPQIAIGGREGANAGHAQFVDEPIWQGAIDAFSAPARLRRVAQDVLDAQALGAGSCPRCRRPAAR